MDEREIKEKVDLIEIYIAMGDRKSVDKIINECPENMREYIIRRAGMSFMIDKLRCC